jgi:plastocyanin
MQQQAPFRPPALYIPGPVVVLATDINAFHIIGGLLALWAVVLAGLGVLNHNFPPKGGEKVIIGISVVLVIGAIASAIAVGGESKPKGGEVAGAKNRTGKEGSPAPSGGTGTPAPGTGANNGQSGPGKSANKQPAQGTAQTLQLSADPSGALKFNKTTLAAKAGNVRIVLSNPAPVPHNISLEGPGGLSKQGPTVSKGGASQVSATLKAGTYTFFCSVPGHRQAGMQGTLTVK